MVETVGLKTGEVPEILYVPPHEPVYQFQFADVPGIPPLIPKEVGKPSHIIEGLAVAEVAGDEFEFTVMVTLLQLVVLHTPAANT